MFSLGLCITVILGPNWAHMDFFKILFVDISMFLCSLEGTDISENTFRAFGTFKTISENEFRFEPWVGNTPLVKNHNSTRGKSPTLNSHEFLWVIATLKTIPVLEIAHKELSAEG